MPVSLPNLGSGRTTCRVLICRHDRSNSNPNATHKGNKSDTLDISSYVNAVSISTNISGGGSGTLNLIPAFPWEDEIAANDIINVYLNTNRGDEGSVYDKNDNTPKYNRGNVRVFFGYVDQISKSISISGSGTRITTYSMSYSSFEKAVKGTEIYSNPNLAFQGDANDTVRPDISNNLGGLILLQKGFPIAGSPRHLVIAHLFRTLGFGGQWILPEAYREDLGKYDSLKQGGKSKFFPWLVKWTTAQRTPEEQKESGMLPFFYKPELAQVSDAKSKGVVSYNTSFRYYPKTGESGGKESRAKSDFQRALELVGSESKIKSLTDISAIQEVFRTIKSGWDTEESTIIAELKETLKFGDGAFYYMNVGQWTEKRKNLLGKLGDITDIIKGDTHSGWKITLNKDLPFWKKFLKEQTPQVTPLINHTTNPDGPVTIAKTLFNILCLDYMEDVDGNYVLSEMYNFGGPLASQIQRQSNALIAELFFDLRVVPDFKVREKDGLGVELDDALPMVPSIVHREKPFTNYDAVTKTHEFTHSSDKIAVGKFSEDDTISAYSDGQLFLKTKGLATTKFVIGGEKQLKSINGQLDKVGLKVEKNTAKSAAKPARKGAKKGKKGNKEKEESAETTNVGAKEVYQFQVKVGNELKPLAVKPYKLEFSLPKPVFRSPDNHRITEELKIASREAVLGYVEKEGDKVKFVAFGVDSEGEGTIKNTKRDDTFGNSGFKSVNQGYEFLLTSPYSGTSSGSGEIAPNTQPTTWHVLDYMTIRNDDVVNESYTRGDFSIANIRELNMDIMPDFEVQRATIRDILPITTPVSIYRNGIRVAANNSTSFVQYMLSGGSTSLSWHQSLGLRWAIMLDMWEQHNHEYLVGSLTIRGMPGLRIGYRIDRKELGLSFYVQSVSHSWEYPGAMMTQVTVNRGQPIEKGKILRYYEPEPFVNSNQQQRMALGRLFRSSQVKDDQQLGAGTLTNLKNKITDLQVKL